ncbi:hypothetical protein [Burkholderia sp. USMB20]|uniref:hypothetical protein n=1 Tax=Burkholderia sp. USMB20 TaxID=1571773 RepID=UPI003FA43F1A
MHRRPAASKTARLQRLQGWCCAARRIYGEQIQRCYRRIVDDASKTGSGAFEQFDVAISTSRASLATSSSRRR